MTDAGKEAVEQILQHYGKKGMHWGIRKRSSTQHVPTDVTVRVTPGQKVVARGGQGQNAHADAILNAAHKQKARASTTDSLSTAELEKLVKRMNLETQYAKLDPKQLTRVQKGKKFAAEMIIDFGKKELASLAAGKPSNVGKVLAGQGYQKKH